MWRALLLALVFCGLAPAARADTVVTLCAADDQAGAGTNLSTAITRGGRITFACGPNATVLMNCHAEIVADTDIDGAGHVTLKDNSASGPGCASPSGSIHYALFHDKPSRTFSLRLAGLQLVGTKPPPQSVEAKLPGQLVFGRLNLALADVSVSGWAYPLAVSPGQVAIDGGVLSDNDGIVVAATDIAVTHGAAFRNNAGAPLSSLGGTVTIADSDFTGNGSGSKLLVCSSIDIRDTRFDANRSADTGGALTVGCDTRISGGSFTRNQARSGGALYIGDTAAHTDLIGVTFEANAASGDGGAVALRYEIYAPIPPPQALALHGVTFRGNVAQVGGALEFARGALPGVALQRRTLSAAGTQFIDNHATQFGGGLLLVRAQADFDGVVFSGNRADAAGGAALVLQSADGRLSLANALLVKNQAPVGAAIGGHAVALVNTTIADNLGPALSGLAGVSPFPPVVAPAGTQPITLRNSIVAGGSGAPCAPADPSAPYVDLGHNLQNGGSACGASIPAAAPQFGPSYIPLPTSPAAHGGDDAACAAAPVAGRDLWGRVRPASGHCAIGAAESDLRQILAQAFAPVIGVVVHALRCGCLKR